LYPVVTGELRLFVSHLFHNNCLSLKKLKCKNHKKTVKMLKEIWIIFHKSVELISGLCGHNNKCGVGGKGGGGGRREK
jgi:hypothetical protein